MRELAELLVRDYGVWHALNLDGGGSSSMVLVDPSRGEPRVLTASARLARRPRRRQLAWLGVLRGRTIESGPG